MNKQKIADFFDRCASWWDEDMIRNEEVIAKILDNGGVREGVHVLDVACGTGVLFPDYLSRGVASVTGIDISPEMVKIAQLIAKLIREGEAAVEEVKSEVLALCARFPLYEGCVNE